MIPVPEKILGRHRNNFGEMIKRVACAKSGFYLMVKHRDHILERTGHYMNMQDRNRYPTQANRRDVFKSGLKIYRDAGYWFF